jgi:hypothetical protein
MTPLVRLVQYGGLISGASLASQVSIRAITRNAPASLNLQLASCCHP